MTWQSWHSSCYDICTTYEQKVFKSFAKLEFAMNREEMNDFETKYRVSQQVLDSNLEKK